MQFLKDLLSEPVDGEIDYANSFRKCPKEFFWFVNHKVFNGIHETRIYRPFPLAITRNSIIFKLIIDFLSFYLEILYS